VRIERGMRVGEWGSGEREKGRERGRCGGRKVKILDNAADKPIAGHFLDNCGPMRSC
jgi:hypothetical protein